MGFTYGQEELVQDIQALFAKHNVKSVIVRETGTLFEVQQDGSLRVGTGARIEAFEQQPDSKSPPLRTIQGGKKE